MGQAVQMTRDELRKSSPSGVVQAKYEGLSAVRAMVYAVAVTTLSAAMWWVV